MAISSTYFSNPAKLTGTPSIAFKHGTQANLNTMRANKSAVEGTFYLTNDTHRMYVGVHDGDAVPVNEGITLVTYAEFETLNGTSTSANAGQFIYITDKNILAVSTGSANGWIQINSVKDTTYSITEGFDATTDNKGVKATFTLSGNDGSSDAFGFTLTGDDGVKVLEGTADGQLVVYGSKISSTVASGTATIGLKGKNDTSFNSSIQIKQGTNVTVSGSDNVITISAKNTGLDGSSSHAAYGTGNKGFKIFAQDSDGATSGGTINPKVKIGIESAKQQTVEFESGVATLPVYTKDEIDAKYLDFNAMTYCGVIENISVLPTTGAKSTTIDLFKNGIHNGDTFVVGTAITTPSAKVGDLVIAHGTEGTDGLLGTVTWQVVASGNEDTTYTFTAYDNGLKFSEKPLGGNETQKASLRVNGDGTYITVKKDATSGNNVVLEVTHNTVTKTSNKDAVTEKDARTINVANIDASKFVQHTANIQVLEGTGVKTDGAGHVTGTQETKWSIKDTNATLHTDSDATAVTVTNNKATITHTTKLYQSNGATPSDTSSFEIAGKSTGNIQITKGSGQNVTIDLVWGSFDT